ncbi:MAG: hypothetical protein NZ890_20475 [Myxococcota bacterium]|nr:hypothetical protein [Myxococcota bacterium]
MRAHPARDAFVVFVLLVERAEGQPFDEADARSLWLAALGGGTDEGYGRLVPQAVEQTKVSKRSQPCPQPLN